MPYSESPVSLRIDGGPRLATRGQKARLLRYWWQQRRVWRTDWDAVIALESDEVKARMANLKSSFGNLFDTKPGPKRADGRSGRKLKRLRAGVEVLDGETRRG